ncbi:unnamed protein product, partial [marine sediment metagenome]
MGSSKEIFPSSTNCIIATPVKAFVIELIAKIVVESTIMES